MIDEKRIAEIRLTVKALRRDARDYRERIFAIGTDKTLERAADEIDYLLEENKSIQDLHDATIAGQETLQREIGRLIDLAGNWKEAADQYHAERNDLQAQLAESQRREQAAIKDLELLGSCVVCEYNSFPCDREDNGHETCFEWRGPHEKCEIAEYVESCPECGFCKGKE